MISFLPQPVRGVIGLLIFAVNTAFWCALIYIVAVFKLLIPITAARRFCTDIMVKFGEVWIDGNDALMWLLHDMEWDVKGIEGINADASYVVWSNHQSWVDITMLQHVFNRRIPFMRFFLKQELLYVPLLGLAWWALDFPFMRRYSKSYLEKHPEMRGKDLDTTRKACEKFRGTRISVLNFLEGTRFTPEKHSVQQSPYRNLLKPKTGGIAFVIDAMGPQFKNLLDVTVYYPDGAKSMWDLFCWIRILWQQKDDLITQLKNQQEPA